MTTIELTAREISAAEFHVKPKLNGYTFNLEQRIHRSSRDNADGIYDAITSFFVAQYATYAKLNSHLDSSEALIFSTYIASRYGAQKLNYVGDVSTNGFGTKRINFDSTLVEVVDGLMNTYSECIDNSERERIKLEATTEAFFDWVMRTTLSTIESSYRNIYTKLNGVTHIVIDAKPIKIDFKEHKDLTKVKRARTIDASQDLANYKKRVSENGERRISIEPVGKAKEQDKTGHGKKEYHEEDFIAGQDYAISQIRDIAEGLRNKEIYLELMPSDKSQLNRLMIGPPGTGKTTIAKLLARESGFLFFAPNPAKFGNPVINESHRQIKDYYDEVEEEIKIAQKPGAVIFLDEIDKIATNRSNLGGGSREDNKVVTVLNTCLLDYLYIPIITIAATNMYDMLDDAIKSRFKPLRVEYPQTDEGVVAIYKCIQRKIESYPSDEALKKYFGGSIFDDIDYKPILAITHTNERYRSGRTIDNVLYEAFRTRIKKNLLLREKQRITTTDICEVLISYDFKDEDYTKNSGNKTVQKEPIACVR
ncbi:ATP-binding protein [Candidatus Woesearchaeota archaeon]|nr:ATP-binding protein [Candidatus Woesearchaeota archaeon]